MAKSIIDIDVNDEKFKEFLSSFNKYQNALKKLPAAWNATGKSAEGMGEHVSDMTAALMAQVELLDKQNKQYANAQKSTGRLVRDSASIAKNLGGATLSLMKWIGIGGILTGLAGAGGLWGLDRLAAGVGNTRRSAQGLGISSAQMQAFGLNFGRYVDPNANLANIANAKSDLSSRWAFTAMGVNPLGKDPAQLAVEMALKAKTIFDQGNGTEQYAQAHGLLQFYTMDELRRLHATSMRDLQASGRGYGSDVKGLALSDATQKKWQDFSITLDRASLKLKTTFIDDLTPLIPNLQKLSGSVVDLLDAFMKNPDFKKWIDDLAKGIEAFAKEMKQEDFAADMKEFATDFAAVCKAIKDGLVLLHIIPADKPGPGMAQPGEGGSGWGFPGAALDPNVYGGGKAAGMDASEMRKAVAIARYFQGQGYGSGGGAGLAANAYAESSFNPMAWGDYRDPVLGLHGPGPRNKKGQYATSYGLFQWNGSRLRDFYYASKELFGHYHNIYDVKDPSTAMKEELMFENYELKHKYKNVAAELKKHPNDAGYAGATVSRDLESPKDQLGNMKSRAATSQVIITVMNQTGGNASVQGSQAAAQ